MTEQRMGLFTCFSGDVRYIAWAGSFDEATRTFQEHVQHPVSPVFLNTKLTFVGVPMSPVEPDERVGVTKQGRRCLVHEMDIVAPCLTETPPEHLRFVGDLVEGCVP